MNTMPRTLSRKTLVLKMNPSCIDVFITNSPLSFQNAIAVPNALPNFHKMVITLRKMLFKKHSPIERHSSIEITIIFVRPNLKIT